MSFKPYTEKIKKKKIEICSILGRIRIRIQNRTIIPEADPRIRIKMIRIRNTAFSLDRIDLKVLSRKSISKIYKDFLYLWTIYFIWPKYWQSPI